MEFSFNEMAKTDGWIGEGEVNQEIGFEHSKDEMSIQVNGDIEWVFIL